MPPQSTACSPKRSVSTSSGNVVVMTPARVAPIAHAYASAVAPAVPLASWCTARSAGTPRPSAYTSRMRCPGAFGATRTTSMSGPGSTSPKCTENA